MNTILLRFNKFALYRSRNDFFNLNFLLIVAYDGLWGYNGVLAMPCISCVFYAFGKVSFLLGLVDTVAVAFAQYALRATMTLQVSSMMKFIQSLCYQKIINYQELASIFNF